MLFYLYILQSESTGKYYVGYTTDPWKRLMEHNTAEHNTYTSKHRPWKLVALFKISESENEAIRIERFIKKQKSRTFIQMLIDTEFQPEGYLAQMVRVPKLRD